MAKADRSALEQRITRFRKLVEEDPGDANSWFELGRALLTLGCPADAATPLRKAVELKPDYTAAHRDLGRALLECGETTEAAEVLARAIGLAEKTGDLQTGRQIHVFLRRAEKALGQS